MTRMRQPARLLGAAGALCALAAAPAAHAQLVTLAPVTLNGGLYHYDYSVTNNTPNDLFDLAIHVMPGMGVVQNLTAPTGFVTSYDSGLGFVDFLENTSNFTAAPLSGFAFDSPLAPQSSTFTANFAPSTGGILSTDLPTLAPQAAAVPEPGTLALALLATPALALIAARRRRAS